MQGAIASGGTSTYSTYGFISPPGITTTIDDEIYYDDAAGAPTASTNWPIGPRQISTIRPASDGTCTFATLSSGTSHFSLVNETNPDKDTSYCEDGTSGDQDLFNMAALGYSPTVINAVVANAYLENPAGGVINNQLFCKSGGTTTASASVATRSITRPDKRPSASTRTRRPHGPRAASPGAVRLQEPVTWRTPPSPSPAAEARSLAA